MATEKRLIDANETINAFKNWLTSRYDGRLPRDIVAEIPTVDAVEVVRCKDCKHYAWDDFDGCYVCLQLSKYVKPDFWCAYRERKDNGK